MRNPEKGISMRAPGVCILALHKCARVYLYVLYIGVAKEYKPGSTVYSGSSDISPHGKYRRSIVQGGNQFSKSNRPGPRNRSAHKWTCYLNAVLSLHFCMCVSVYVYVY